MSNYERIARFVRETPWAIEEQMLHKIEAILSRRIAGERLELEEVRSLIEGGPGSRSNLVMGGVAVLPIAGVIMPKATMFTEISGGTSLDVFRSQLREAVASPEVGAILLDVDSPGGSAELVPETAAEIRASRGRKPITAIANTFAASAAYWLASQADELVVTPSGQIGSIGCYIAHTEYSKADEMAGITTTMIRQPERKARANDVEPLDEEARAAMQAMVDEVYGMFVNDVAKGRGTNAKDVRDNFGRGEMVMPGTAKAAGMVDRIATFEQTIQRLSSGGGVSRRASAEALEVHIDGEVADEDALLEALQERLVARALADDVDVMIVSDESDDIVPGAEQLLRRRGIREAFAPN